MGVFSFSKTFLVVGQQNKDILEGFLLFHFIQVIKTCSCKILWDKAWVTWSQSKLKNMFGCTTSTQQMYNYLESTKGSVDLNVYQQIYHRKNKDFIRYQFPSPLLGLISPNMSLDLKNNKRIFRILNAVPTKGYCYSASSKI